MIKNLVSVVIPCYNNADTIAETLQSVRNQTYNNIEIIVVNDGSTDASDIMINTFKNDTLSLDFQYYKQTNSGPSITRNNGAAAAKGEYIMFLDADDLLHETYIEKAINVLINQPTINIVYSNTEFFGAETGLWNLKNFEISDFLKYNSIPIFALIRNEVFQKVGGFDTNLSFTEDWELWIRIVKQYGGVFKINETLFYYRKRENKSSLSDNMNVNDNSDLSRLYIYNKHYDFYKENGLDLTSLVNTTYQLQHLKVKYSNIWYRKIFKILKK
jgi:glycosyltransferase involved in cell wall biosynthesis